MDYICLSLFSYSKDVLEFLKEGQKLTEDVLHSVIGWLMGWPAGFKLNENLDKFLGLLFLYYIDVSLFLEFYSAFDL